jgi:hypothetical protein
MNDDVPSFLGVREVSPGAFDMKGVADTLTEIHDTVAEAVEAAVAHTLIDGAAHEVFVDDGVDASVFRDAIRRLNDAGYGIDPDRTAFYAGEYAVDAAKDALPHRVEDAQAFDGDAALHVDGVPIHEASKAPAAIAIAVDVDALAKIPPKVIARRFRAADTTTVSSPVMVADPDGVVVINIAEDGGDE